MATIREIREGLELFERHGGEDIAAEHDMIHAGQGDGVALTPDDVTTLQAAGWFITRELCRGCAQPGEADAVEHDATADKPAWHALTCREWAHFV